MSLGKIGKLTNVFNAFKQSPFSNKSDMISSLAAFGNINKAAQGNNSFDITEYLNVGANTIRLTITDSFGTLATKTWTVTIVEFKLESTFDDTLLYTNTDVVFRYTPYGNVNKTLHFILDEKDLGTVETQSSGRIMSYNIPKQEHGSHLLKGDKQITDVKCIGSNLMFFSGDKLLFSLHSGFLQAITLPCIYVIGVPHALHLCLLRNRKKFFQITFLSVDQPMLFLLLYRSLYTESYAYIS